MGSALLPLLLLLGAAAGYYTPTPEHSHGEEHSGFLLPLPYELHAGTDDFCRHPFVLHHIPGPLIRKVKLTFSDSDNHPLFDAEKEVAADRPATTIECLSVPVPLNITSTDKATVTVELETAAGVMYTDQEQVKLRGGSSFPLAKTSQDKPQYRPGDHAHFQLTLLDSNLRPPSRQDGPQTIPEVWVTNSAGLRVAQWRDTPLKYGVARFDLNIAEEFVPPSHKPSTIIEDGTVATWKIHYKADNFYKEEEFHVGEVAPPPAFTVDITSPQFIPPSGRTVTIGVCASYLFGAPLRGAGVTLEEREHFTPVVDKFTPTKTNSSGCAVLDIIFERGASYSGLHVKINVTDPASGESEQRDVDVGEEPWYNRNRKETKLLSTFETIPANLSRTILLATYDEDEKPAINKTVRICSTSLYYPPSRSVDSQVDVPGGNSPFVDYSLLLPPDEMDKLTSETRQELNAIPLLWEVGGSHVQRTREECRLVLTNSEGIARYQLPKTASRVHAVDVRWLQKQLVHTSYASESFRVLTSPSNSYLALDLAAVPAKLPCRGDVKLPLHTTVTENMPPVQLQVMARGRVVATEVTDSSHPLELTLHMTPEMSPKVRLLVYGQLASGEVLADSVQLPVEECFPNEVTVSWDHAEHLPRDEASVHVSAAPHSRCTISVKGAGLGHRKRGRKSYELTSETVTEILRGLDVPAAAAPEHAGFVPFATMGVNHATCVKKEVHFWERRRKRHARYIGGRVPSPYAAHAEEEVWVDDRAQVIHHDIHTLDEHGSGHVTVTLPDQATSWVASAVCTHPQEGLGISKKVPIKVSKPLFGKITIPHSIKSGEVLTVPLTVFNNYDSYVSVHVELDNPEYIFSGETPDGPQQRYANVDYSLCIAPRRSEIVRWSVRFNEPGSVNISVTLEARSGSCDQPNTVHPPREIVRKEIVVRPDGFKQEDVTTHFVCLDSGDSRSVVVDLPHPNELVHKSAWLYVSVFGDLLEPSRLLLQSEVKEPAYGPEPNMIDVVSNVYIHEYLTANNLMTSDLKTRTESHIAKGLRRALQYQREDGSFSSHGNTDREGSLWFTVLTIKTFQDAAKFHPDVASQLYHFSASAEWVLRHQQEDGCFRPVGELLHQELRGGVEKDNTGAMTAYVLLSLHDVIENYRLADGLRCVDDYVSRPYVNLYTKALVAYTYLQLNLESRSRQLVQDLLKHTTTEGEDVLYWRDDRNVPVYGVRPVADLEMTSYMVLSLIELSGADNMLTANKAIKWIVKQRGDTFFDSPQATATSLQALAAFARRTYSSEAHSTVSVTVGNDKPYYVHVNAQNRLLQQIYKVKDVQLPTRVRFQASEGCVTLQTTLRYTSHSKIPHPAFSLSTTVTERPSSVPGSTYNIHVCVESTPDFERSDKALMTIELPSGFVAAKSSLRDQRYNGKIQKADIDDDTVKVTLVDITRHSKCFDFRIVRAAEVDQLKPAVIHIKDTYEPGREGRLEYTLQQEQEEPHTHTTRPGY